MRDDLHYISTNIEEKRVRVDPAFHNDLFTIYPWEETFSLKEMNLLFGMIALLNNNDNKIINADYGMIRMLGNRTINESPGATSEFIINLINKISSIDFDLISINDDYENQSVEFKLKDDKYHYLFNALTDDFTEIELTKLQAINGLAGKKLYILLSSYRGNGTTRVPMNEFRNVIDSKITKNYSNRRFKSKVLIPAIEEMNVIDDKLTNFNIEEVKNYKGDVIDLLITI